MITYAPNYYKDFKCKADKCKHSCCIGWEIDIDEEALSYYEGIKGHIGDKLKKCVSYDGEPHFILDLGDRCPFLKSNGLCELICEFGEESLCNICTDHPRYRNFYFDSVEIGLGLCCEKAAEIIVNAEEPFKLISLDGSDTEYADDEKYIIDLRQKLICTMQDRRLTINERFGNIFRLINSAPPEGSLREWCDFYLSLERLNEEWTDEIESLKNTDIKFGDFSLLNGREEIAAEQLAVYFLYRHMPPAIWDDNAFERVKLSYVSCALIIALYVSKGQGGLDVLAECARMYSSEIEYSDENVDSILQKL